MAYGSGYSGADRRLERGATQFIVAAEKEAITMRARYSVDPKRHPDSFDQGTVIRDLATVQKREAGFARSDSPEKREEAMISNVFEVSLWFLTQNKQFLGEGVKAILPSRFDDYMNGTDLILELAKKAEEATYLGLSIDATFGVQAVEGKLDALPGGAGSVKYYVSPDGKRKGTLEGIPRAVVGLSVAHAREIAQLWRLGDAATVRAEQHPLRVLVLQQLVAEAGALSVFARSRGNDALAEQYETVRKHLQPIYAKALSMIPPKGWVDPEGNDYRKDPVYTTIMLRTESWRKRALVKE